MEYPAYVSVVTSNSERTDDFDLTNSPGQVMKIIHDCLDLPLAWDQ